MVGSLSERRANLSADLDHTTKVDMIPPVAVCELVPSSLWSTMEPFQCHGRYCCPSSRPKEPPVDLE